MRVLCLHPAGSSAYEHGTQFSALAYRLRKKHGIELIFVDAPLLDATTITTTTTGKGGGQDTDDKDGINDDKHHRRRRRWYVKEEERSATPQHYYYSGLDASLLHLSQLYNKIGNIVGVLGIGQGAHVAALLPLLTNEHNYSGQNDNDDDYNNDATTTTTPRHSGYNNNDNNHHHQRRTMFPGLEFVILVDGSDILCLGGSDDNNKEDNCNHATLSDTTAAAAADVDIAITNNDNNFNSEGDNLKKNIDYNDTDDDDDDDDDDDGSYYVGTDGVHSLHVIFDEDGGIPSSSSERLAKMYGPNATIHRIPSSSSSSPRSVVSATMKLTSSLLARLSNIIGRYIVSQKNIHSRIIPTSSTNGSSCSSSSGTTNISRQITKLRKRLWDVEQLATIAIAEEIRCNPPKALMAVIGPAAILSPMTNDDEEEKVGDIVEDVIEHVIEHVIEKDNVDNMKTNVNAKVVVDFDEAQSSSSVAAAEKDSINTNTLVVDKVVGAWQGGRRREFGEDGGGAPCPQEFVLREDERR